MCSTKGVYRPHNHLLSTLDMFHALKMKRHPQQLDFARPVGFEGQKNYVTKRKTLQPYGI